MNAWFQSISSLFYPLLEGLYRFTRDWGLAVVALTLLVKAALFYFNLLAARQQVRTAAIQPRLAELRTRLSGEPEKLGAETLKLYREQGVNPLLSFGAILVQMPVLMGMYGLFLTHGGTMTSILLPWLSHLALADPYHLVPALTALMSCITGLIPLTANALPSASGSSGSRIAMALLVGLIPLAFMWRSPAALGLYWLTSTGFGLAERGLYRTRWGKRLLARRA